MTDTETNTIRSAPPPVKRRWRLMLMVALVVTVLVVLLSVAGRHLASLGASSDEMHVLLPSTSEIVTHCGDVEAVAISLDGRMLAYGRASGQILVRDLSSGSELEVLSGDAFGELPNAARYFPILFVGFAFSPGNDYVYFSPITTQGVVTFRVPASGGRAVRVFTDRIDCMLPVSNSVSVSDMAAKTVIVRGIHGGHEDSYDAPVCQAGLLRHEPVVWSPSEELLAMPCDSRAVWASLINVRSKANAATGFSHEALDGYVRSLVWAQSGLFAEVFLEDGRSQIRRVEYPSGVLRFLTDDDFSYKGVSSDLSGAGVASVRNDWLAEVSTVRLADGYETPITHDETSQHGRFGVQWIASGRLLFTSVGGGFHEVHEFDPSSGSTKTVFKGDAVITSLSASSTGDVIAMGRMVDRTRHVDLVELGSGTATRLVSWDADNPVVYPGGDRVMVTRNPSGGAGFATVILNLLGEELVVLPPEMMGLKAVSAEDDRVAILNVKRGLVVAELPSLSILQQTAVPLDYCPEPDQDCRLKGVLEFRSSMRMKSNGAVIVVGEFDGTDNLWQINQISQPQRVTNFDDSKRIFSFDFSPDESHVVISRGHHRRNVVLFSIER